MDGQGCLPTAFVALSRSMGGRRQQNGWGLAPGRLLGCISPFGTEKGPGRHPNEGGGTAAEGGDVVRAHRRREGRAALMNSIQPKVHSQWWRACLEWVNPKSVYERTNIMWQCLRSWKTEKRSWGTSQCAAMDPKAANNVSLILEKWLLMWNTFFYLTNLKEMYLFFKRIVKKNKKSRSNHEEGSGGGQYTIRLSVLPPRALGGPGWRACLAGTRSMPQTQRGGRGPSQLPTKIGPRDRLAPLSDSPGCPRRKYRSGISR